MNKKVKVMIVFGTRPEAIKMCPLVLELRNHSTIETIVCVTGQHKEMLQQVLDIFDVIPDYNLDIMRPKQSITTITTDILLKIENILDDVKPDIVLVHGDTTTSMATALASFYKKIPVGHVEAGLRTHNKYSPFPEEVNRVLISKLADYHFAPTINNQEALKEEGISCNIYVTGNTVIDAFQYTVKDNYTFTNNKLNTIDYSKRIVLITAHRRENLGEPLQNICKAIKRLANEYREVEFIYPVHLNPSVRQTVYPILDNINNIHLIDPINVMDMHNLMARCYFVMTDSGGMQEEAPHLGKPVLVLRTETERPEAVEAGTVKVVGINETDIYNEASKLFNDKDIYIQMSKAINPYGDGHASERIVKTTANLLHKNKLGLVK